MIGEHGRAQQKSKARELQDQLPPRLHEAPCWWAAEQVPCEFRPAVYWLSRFGRLPRRDAVPGMMLDRYSGRWIAYYTLDDTEPAETINDDWVVTIDLRTGSIRGTARFE